MPSPPDAKAIEAGGKYSSFIERRTGGCRGGVNDEHGTNLFGFGYRSLHGKIEPPLFLSEKEFYFGNAGAKEKPFTIHRTSRFPSVFLISENGLPIGRIHSTGWLRNRYAIRLDGADEVRFHIPRFTTGFYGESGGSTSIWVIVGPSKMEWNILTGPSLQQPPLIAAIAFLHLHWWNAS
jgi:hypothetical protein